MLYELRHTTTYLYEGPVLHGRHLVRKRPRSSSYQTRKGFKLEVVPEPVWIAQQTDYFGNETDLVEVLGSHDRLSVTARTRVEVGARPASLGLPLVKYGWEEAAELLARDRGNFEASEYRFDSPLVRRHGSLRKYAETTFTPGKPLVEGVLEFNERIFTEFTYDPNVTDVSTPLAQVLRERRGVCQDFAHVAVGALRSLGLSARYVSGYLETSPPPGKEKLIGADASHAWASVYVPGFGWLDFDPTNNVLPGERHILLACGRDYSDVSPLKGVVHGGGRHVIQVGVDVLPVAEEAEPAPRSVR